MLNIGMLISSRYYIEEYIGIDGMFDVYNGMDNERHENICIKVLTAPLCNDRDTSLKICNDICKCLAFNHENLVNIRDVDEDNGTYYVITDPVEGITLSEYINSGSSKYDTKNILLGIATGLQAAHNEFVVHKFLNPENIYILDNGQVKINNLGLSAATLNPISYPNVKYISPELAQSDAGNDQSDIYSFGVIAYELLTGHVPFNGSSAISIAFRHVKENIDVNINSEYDSILGKCLAKDKADRYQMVGFLINDLKKCKGKKSKEKPAEEKSVICSTDKKKTEGFILQFDTSKEKQNHKAYSYDTSSDVKEDGTSESDNSSWLNTYKELSSINDYDNNIRPEDNIFYEKQNEQDSFLNDNCDAYDDDDDFSGTEKVMKYLGIALSIIVVVVGSCLITYLFTKKDNNTVQSEVANIQSMQSDDEPDSSSGEKVFVPSLVGKTEAEAKDLLNSIGLGYKSIKEYSSSIAQGMVMEQGIDSGNQVDKHSTISLKISAGPDVKSVPNVVGMHEQDAATTLEAAGFTISIKKVESSDISSGKVISQTPKGYVTSDVTVVLTVAE